MVFFCNFHNNGIFINNYGIYYYRKLQGEILLYNFYYKVMPLLWKMTKKYHYYGIFHMENYRGYYFYRDIPLLWKITGNIIII